MPETEIQHRSDTRKWRTVKLPNGKIVHIALVKKSGSRGAKTAPARLRTKKGQK